MMISHLIWNGNPEILSIGSFSLRWYGLLFALGFLISQQLLFRIYRQEGKPEKDIETLTIYMVVATVLGARLGHVFFYQPEMLWQDPLGVLLPVEFTPKFRFTGLQGLASHGAAIGILFALWLYSRKKKPGQNYLQVLDRIVIMVALTGCLIRLGNFFNSEIIGKPTDSPLGVVFAGRITETFSRNSELVTSVSVRKNTKVQKAMQPDGITPIYVYVFFQPGTTRETADNFAANEAKFYLARMTDFVDEPVGLPLNYKIIEETPGQYVAQITTNAIVRHPAQLYESISCLVLFALLYWLWSRKKEKTQPGLIFAWFMVILWSLRFAYEFLKKNQVPFEDELPLNMGQILSIPLALAGVALLVWVYRKKSLD
jgi:prolipoprotein diacylglyceryl transferase